MKKNKTLKYLLIGVGALIVLSIIGKKAGWFGKGKETKVSSEKVMRRTITETVSASGKVEPEVEVKISSDVSGELVELNVKEGDLVQKGQLLAKINPNIYESTVARANASMNTTKANLASDKSRLTSAESQLARNELSYNRSKKLFDQAAISASDFEIAKSAFEVSKADVESARQAVMAGEFNVKSAEASVRESQDNLLKTSIFAPVSGTVSKLNVERGERILGTTQMTGTEIMRIADLKEMEVSVDVNESDIVRVHMADTAMIEVDAYLNRKFKGIVTEIANTASTVGANTDQVTNFTVKIRILRESYSDLIPKEIADQSPFRPGMSATVDIRTKTVTDVLSVPVQSVTTRDTAKDKKDAKKPSSGQASNSASEKKKQESLVQECVFLVDSSKAKITIVKTGVQDNSYIEIVSGLKENEEVISGPYSAVSKSLKDGEKVVVVDKEKLFEKEKE